MGYVLGEPYSWDDDADDAGTRTPYVWYNNVNDTFRIISDESAAWYFHLPLNWAFV